MEDLTVAIAEAQEYYKCPPPNEQSTCDWVIVPLLHAIGYSKGDILPKDYDAAGKFPDYTILPDDGKHKFYLEAKKWMANLEDEHVNQALNYANQNGKRWAVLTNGRAWRLYDNKKDGLAREKLAAEMSLENEDEARQFLEAIGRGSVMNDRLEAYANGLAERRAGNARRALLRDVFDRELECDESALVVAMQKHLQGRDGLKDIRTREITSYFGKRGTAANGGASQRPSVPANAAGPRSEGPASGDWHNKLCAVNCAATTDAIRQYKIYRCPARGGAFSFKRCRFFGIYSGKRVAVVAEIEGVVDVNKDFTSALGCNNTLGGRSDGDLMGEAVARLRAYRDKFDDTDSEHREWFERCGVARVFVLGEQFNTCFEKDSPGGMFGTKQYFDVGAIKAESAGDLARKLDRRRWSEFEGG
jgi:predicted type IV restriction endonuclease